MLRFVEALAYLVMSVIYFDGKHTPARRIAMGTLALSLAVTNFLDSGNAPMLLASSLMLAINAGGCAFIDVMASGVVFLPWPG